MCFNSNYDWIASVSEETSGPAAAPTLCDECRETVPVGATLHHLHQEEYEDCQVCYLGECSCPDEECCQCPSPTFGETFDWDCCDGCGKFLKAVQAAEEEAGCTGPEARPALGMMCSDIQDGGVHEARRYVKKVRELFPELLASGHLQQLWRKMFGNG